ncbi:MAG: chorismate mutase/prephenate dehydratase [Woeseiaceae bacterium]
MTKQAKKDGTAVDLTSIRTRIDEVDKQIHALINERATFAQQVGISKGELAAAVDYYRPEREAEVLRAVLERNEGPLRDEEILRLFREIMSACLAQQEPLKVGYLGPEGTFTQTAVYKHFGHSVRGLPYSTIDEVFQEVESGVADFGVVPIENSTEGTVNHTLDMFLTSPLKIGGEIEMRIEQHLLGNTDGLGSIKRICAHEQSLAQCRGWLREYLPQVELIGVASNATGARRARDEAGTAAIGGDAAAEVYDLKIMVNNIEDRDDNSTRFLVVGRELLSASGQDKTTILVSTSGTVGAGVLHNLLQPIATHGVSMTRIESRPSRRQNWDYVFFIDLDGHAEESPLKDALQELQKNSSLFRLIGAYPKAVR